MDNAKSKICRFAHTQTNIPIMTQTYIPAEFYHTYRHCKLIIRSSILFLLTLHRSKNLAVMSCIQINSSRSINRSQEQRSSIVQPSSLISHPYTTCLLSPAKETSRAFHQEEMAEKATATHLITVYRAERQRRVRPLPRRGQIKLKIAHIVAHSIASTLLRTFSQLPVLDQK